MHGSAELARLELVFPSLSRSGPTTSARRGLCGRSRETVNRSDLAGWAQHGYCASHSRYFWGLRLHLVCTLHGLPVTFALTGAEADERETLLDMLAIEPQLPSGPQQPDVQLGQLLLEFAAEVVLVADQCLARAFVGDKGEAERARISAVQAASCFR
ncbi:hypothetical protein Airi02_104330 [Actinoallomurus iriomotensis]|uniref:Transposase n=1 Tax=Actinoallomurus iriomotensis TaxID=478107 RepID=A0A9W6SCX4_9ACTN|nr:hypothetical protein Airi02_104330 [Actinoallomurus iriomotensis]